MTDLNHYLAEKRAAVRARNARVAAGEAQDHEIAIDSLEVEVSGRIDPRGGQPGFEHIPVPPHDIAYTVHLAIQTTPAKPKATDAVAA